MSNSKLELITRENVHHLFLTKTNIVSTFTKSLKTSFKDLIIQIYKVYDNEVDQASVGWVKIEGLTLKIIM